jgi:uridylate kinase
MLLVGVGSEPSAAQATFRGWSGGLERESRPTAPFPSGSGARMFRPPSGPPQCDSVAAVVMGAAGRDAVIVPRYRRVLVKLSGEALAGTASTGVDPDALAMVANEVLSVRDLGVQVAVVVGGGNYFRGRMAEGWGISRAEADNIGMLGTVMNALMLRGALTARTDLDVRVMTAVPMQSVAEPFIRLRAVRHLEHGVIVLLAGGIGQPYVTTDYPAVQRALELDADALLVAKRGVDGVYDSDPRSNPDAVRFSELTYEKALAIGVRVMDTSAFVLANEQALTMHVFDVGAIGVMRQICEGAELGTRISVD